MYVLKDNLESLIEIKKSKFITKIYKVYSIDEVNTILDKLREEYKDSTHICYAYKIGNVAKFSDDGEPGGTAGLPILNVLKKNNLTNVLAIVIRYFGGIKLGAGGLVRAYTNSITEILKNIDIIELEEGYLIELEFPYDQVKLVDYMLIKNEIISKEYNDNVIYKFYLNKNELDFIPNFEKIAIHVSIKDKVLIKKCKD